MRHLNFKNGAFVAGAMTIPAGIWHFSLGAALVVLGVELVIGAVLWHLGERK